MEVAAALELRDVAKVYPGGVRAVDGVDFVLRPGEIHALCGENGAGKSTLAQIAAGRLRPTRGRVVANGPVGLVHQQFELVDRLRVWENVVLGREPRRGPRIDAAAAREHVRTLGAQYGLDVDPAAIVEELPAGIAQRVEILRELAREPRVLLLDEPTAVLGPAEIDAFFATLHALASRGTAILVITHKLAEVVSHAARVTVLRGGRVVMRAATADTSLDAIARAMVGGDVPPLAPRARTTPAPMFAARGLASGDGAHALHEATFEVRGGEIVGIAGVEGNGQSALCDAIAGVAAYRGEMTLGGTLLRPLAVRHRLAAGLRVIPQDRACEALVLDWSVAENAALGDQHALDRRALAVRAATIVRDFDVRPATLRTRVRTLSGGNAQKLVVGRALASAPRCLIAYQPTRGIDVGAAALVQSRLIAARNTGAAVLLVSFELDELLALADRVLVLFRGRIAGAFARDAFDRAPIGAAMSGAQLA